MPDDDDDDDDDDKNKGLMQSRSIKTEEYFK
jgi:hypothetical protein